ncbi:MAG: ligand-binding sensor domain-containing protein, partial [Bacteroidota bacterium]
MLPDGRRFVKQLRYALLMACFMVPSFFFARDFSIKTYTRENGLQNELVKAVAIDSIGFLWIGTDHGLFRYNGEEFTNYGKLLNSHYVKSLLYDRRGNLYFTTDMSFGKIVYSGREIIAQIIAEGSVTKTEGMLWYPKQLYEDQHGNIWFSDNTSVYRYQDGSLNSYFMGDHNLTSGFARSFSFFEDDRGQLGMISQTGNFYRYNPVIDIVEPVENPHAFKNVSAVQPIGNRRMLIGFNDRLGEIAFDDHGNVDNYRLISSEIDASAFVGGEDGVYYSGSWSNGLWKIMPDGQGNYFTKQVDELKIRGGINQLLSNDKDLIVASDNGVAVMQQKMFTPLLQQFSSEYINDVAYDAKNRKIYVTDGNSVFQIDEETLEPMVVFSSPGPGLLQVLPDKDFVWVGDDAGFLHRILNGRVIQSFDLTRYGAAVYHLTLDPNSNLWICQDNHNGILMLTPDGHIHSYGLPQGLVTRANFAANSPFSYIFVGATGASNFLYYFNLELNTFNNLSREIPFEFNGNLSINDLAFDDNGVMWLGSSHGLLRLRGNEITRPDLEEITGEEIKALAVDENNHIWFASSTGISKFDGTGVVTFDQSNGLPSKTANYRCLITDSQNRIWAGTLAGLSVSNHNEPPVKTASPVLLSVTKSGVPLEDISISGFDNLGFIGFSFISPEYPSESLKYRVKVAGYDNAWRQMQGRNEFMLSDLPPGNYKLLVSAKQRGNYLWSDPMVYTFNIHRIWYQTWWAWTAFALLLLLVIYQGAKWQSRRLENEKRKLNKLVRERTEELELKTKEIEAKNIQLLRAKEEAEASSLAKAEFLSTM